mmetsp:Transcript_9235/g.17378  ORF Transcript_9235/g.17378 Transcript_9235/m.17378 type:complete len:255 (+) Transcript_9235:650-1414(+)
MTMTMTMTVFLQQGLLLQQHYFFATAFPSSSASSSLLTRSSSRMSPLGQSFTKASFISQQRHQRHDLSFTHHCNDSSRMKMSDDWSSFQALDDDDDIDDYNSKNNPQKDSNSNNPTSIQYADENDPQEYKAQVGSNIPPPSIEWQGEPIFLPQGSILPLTEENVQGVLAACRQEIGTMFGYSAENRGVGITGGVDFVDLDGPTVILKLHGRFWHQRTTVLERVGKYLQARIPEIVDCTVEDPWELTDEANNDIA